MIMASTKAFYSFFKTLFLFFSLVLHKRLRSPSSSLHRKVSSLKFRRFSSLACNRSDELLNQTIVFDVEGTLLRSSSLFPYFMLVAFEAGGLLRALVLLLFYPFICFMISEEMGLNLMVMVCFLGIKREKCRVGRAVLPKFFLEDVGLEGFEVVMRFGRKVGISCLPTVMVDGFLRDYLQVDCVVGRELKVFHGYCVGLMEEKNLINGEVLEVLENQTKMGCDVVALQKLNNKCHEHPKLFSYCKKENVYMVSETEKRNWHELPKVQYPQPLIFHDGRLAFRPTPLATLAVIIWVPFGVFLAIFRALIALLLPYNMMIPILSFSGMRFQTSPNPIISSATSKQDPNVKGLLYVCNHRTLLDPLYLSAAIRKPLTAVTYSLSRVSEVLAPIRTIRLTRDRDEDAKMMKKLLSEGDLVVCPEGTTCREPYLLRFSPLFAEMSDEIAPVAMHVQVTMFYGTTAGGLKCLDPLFFLMNPSPIYHVQFLEKVSRSSTCHDDAKSRFDVANHIQKELGQVLGFECTKLTRKDKYLILAGNEGNASSSPKHKIT
ncbi:probable glycerol-3-phosphate acyltransferase 3 [Macadamia integrifolia]|uniref:probable glycerol-3-phosphate acyltransferase 3 n=1 Tax=Macadamia integrifolia TaxID=60698 RepID=UPI001C4FAC1F|nr:probable glycerol-3-phosphate acyltransferase 3 [Macadamia integrifolia]